MGIFNLLDNVKELLVVCGAASDDGPAIWKKERYQQKKSSGYGYKKVECDGRCGVCNNRRSCPARR